MKAVIAIGGNALVTPGADGDIGDQFSHSRGIARRLADLVQGGWQITLTHGNGPQVGTAMRRIELSADVVYPLDLGLAVAETQGVMGYMLAQTIGNELRRRGVDRECVALLTTVVVDSDDPAFKNPTKPIGSFLTAEQAEQHRRRDGWTVVEDAGRGFRRVVPSPPPKSIVQIRVIRELANAGHILIAGGGGGIPVVMNNGPQRDGVEAVIDKDFTSAMIAAEIEADALVMVTGVDCVRLNFGKPDESPLRRSNVAEMKTLIDEGHFGAGSMLPKIEASLNYLTQRGDATARAIITDWPNLPDAVAGTTGTTITL